MSCQQGRRMDQYYAHASAPLEQAAGHGAGAVEPWDGAGALLRVDRGQHVAGNDAAAPGEHRPTTVARVVLRGRGQAGRPKASARGGGVLCVPGAENLAHRAGHAVGPGARCHHAGDPRHGSRHQHGLSRLCHPRALDDSARHCAPCLAPRVAAAAAAAAAGHSPPVDHHRAG
jgi:hypothetical protein